MGNTARFGDEEYVKSWFSRKFWRYTRRSDDNIKI